MKYWLKLDLEGKLRGPLARVKKVGPYPTREYAELMARNFYLTYGVRVEVTGTEPLGDALPEPDKPAGRTDGPIAPGPGT